MALMETLDAELVSIAADPGRHASSLSPRERGPASFCAGHDMRGDPGDANAGSVRNAVFASVPAA